MIGQVNLRDVSVANLTVGGGDPVALIEAAARAGFGAVGLVIRTATGKPLSHEVIDRPEMIRAIKGACSATGVRVFDVEGFILAPGVDIDDYRPALATGAELGATHISSIGTEWAGNSAFLSGDERIDLFGRLCDAAAEYGLHVGVEFMLYRDIRTYDEALAMIDAAGRSNAGLILDTLHFHRGGGRADQLGAIAPERIAYLQLCDAGPDVPLVDALAVEARTARLYPGQGTIPLNAILDAVPDGVQIVVETPVPADAGRSVEEKIMRAAEQARSFFAHRAETQAQSTAQVAAP